MNLKEFLAQFGMPEKKADLLNRSYFVINDTQFLSKRPLYVGKCIAHIRGPALIPSVDLLQDIGRGARRHVVLDAKGEWLFICGRDVFAKSITSHTNPVVGDMVAILNSHKECIGYGQMNAPLTEQRVVIKRLFDLGDLLRRERKTRKVRH